ncbi:hypothetical protein Mterra_02923 [Calidithermus terrae]|uniref:Uncharacterized protein n=1 Tax=Calidithermus terrae TaxID=1408545 RepID=A0A399ED69_9DEIN|nr:hypothetical protein [Calidithermus terrae]RIH81878.1 hypothetical protein Mterra_02923 [Calidithermus terrae]
MVERLDWNVNGWIWVKMDAQNPVSRESATLVIDTDEMSKAEEEAFWAELESKGFVSTIESRELFTYLQTRQRRGESLDIDEVVKAFAKYLEDDTWPQT